MRAKEREKLSGLDLRDDSGDLKRRPETETLARGRQVLNNRSTKRCDAFNEFGTDVNVADSTTHQFEC